MTDQRPDWSDLASIVAVGDRLTGTILRVDRWGLQLDLRLPFDGFMDRLHIGNDLERYQQGQEIEVIVVQLAEYNHQIRVRPLTNEDLHEVEPGS
jgi:ribosomal protein S1